jgi:NAD(P)-dependent dehydrogenase (short-subunit alcohol dehydrogenase family)
MIEATLLEVVSQLTGYPTEMLGLDMDIEAELGIDSIKRVEILSALEEKMPDLPSVSPDVMGTLDTLGQIIAYFANPIIPETSQEPARENQPQGLSVVTGCAAEGSLNSDPTANDSAPVSIPRHVVTVVDAPPVLDTTVPISETKKVLVTADQCGLSEAIAAELANVGVQAAIIKPDALKNNNRPSDVAGLIIVQNPRSNQMDQDLKDAFGLAKFWAPNLIAAGGERGAIFATVTRLDGAFGLRPIALQFPIQGGLAGLSKTAALEWQNVCCHAIDVAPEWSDNRSVAAAVVKEVLSPGPVEIGLNPGYRCTLSLEPAPQPAGFMNLSPDDVIVISGGARGVTAAAALELAKHTGTKLFLFGRSPEPSPEPAWLSALENKADIKRALLDNEYRDKSATPAEVQKRYQYHLANREIADNLKKLNSTGASVYYYSVDVRNLDSVQAAIDDIRRHHGPVAGIIHGAGVLEDRLITAKTLEQFERVYDTKVGGLKNLLRATRRDPLKYLVLFSSVTARLGNKGQADYAVANEALNKIAQTESAKRADCRVTSINWGPWDGGMVTSTLKHEFERQGIHLIRIDDGAKAMLSEMKAENDSPVEIVLGAELNAADPKSRKLPMRPELVKSSSSNMTQALALAFEREIDVHRYPVLKSHIIDGKPVVPLALVTEWFAHGALHENPGLILRGLDDIRVMKGIRLEPEPKCLQLLAGKPKKNGNFYEVAVELRDGERMNRNRLHAKAKAILGDTIAVAPAYQFTKPMVAEAYTKTINEVYDKILFHGLQLQGIRKIVSCSSWGMVAHIATAPAPGEWLTEPLRNQWIADPLVLDCAFQMATVWCFEEKGIVSLPSYGASYRQYCEKFSSNGVTAVLEIKDVTRRRMRGNFTFLDADDAIVGHLDGYEAIMDASLLKAFKPRYRASA